MSTRKGLAGKRGAAIIKKRNLNASKVRYRLNFDLIYGNSIEAPGSSSFVKTIIVLIGIFFLILSTQVVSGKDFIINEVSNPSTTYFMINGTSGNVGIGIANPTEKLHVSGNVRLQGSLNEPLFTSGGPNLINNPESIFGSTAGWILTAGYSNVTVTGPAGTEVRAIYKSSNITQGLFTDYINVDPKKAYILEFWIWQNSTSAGTNYLGREEYTTGLVDNDQGNGPYTWSAQKPPVAQEWHHIYGIIPPYDAGTESSHTPTTQSSLTPGTEYKFWAGNSTKVKIKIYINYGGTISSDTYVTGVALRELGGSSQTAAFSVDSNGRVGLKTTSPTSVFDVRGDVSLNNSLFVTNAGNVGIGTSSPGHRLTIAGTFNTTGLSYFGSNISVGGYQIRDLGTPKLSTDAATKAYVDSVTGGGSATWTHTGSYTILNNSGDYVGIGTATPGSKLEVLGQNITLFSGSTSQNVSFNIFDNSGSTAGFRIRYEDYTGATYLESLYDNAAGDIAIRTKVAGTPVSAIFIESAGNVGIGTNSPKGKLEIYNIANTSYGNGSSSMSYSGQDSLVLYGHGSVSGNTYGAITWDGGGRRRAMITGVAESADTDYIGLAFYTQGTDGAGDIFESMRISHAGNVGIGTATPGQKLTVVGTANVTGLSYFGANVSMGGYQIRDLGTPKLSTDAATKAYVDSITGGGSATWSLTSGVVHLNDTTDKVSIGGTTSGYKLDVVGNVSLNNRLFVTNTGNVGIGTNSPTTMLEIKGDTVPLIKLTRTSAANSNILFNNTAYQIYAGMNPSGVFGISNSVDLNGAPFLFAPSSGALTVNNSLYVTSSGRVGIGTSSPSFKLDMPGENDTLRVGNRLFASETVRANSSDYAILTHVNGSALDTTYQYRVTLNIDGTGTDQGASYLVWYAPDSLAWNIRNISRAGSNSNHPELTLDSGVVKIRTSHASMYNIRVNKEAIYTSDNDALPNIWGADYMWQRDVDNLFYPDGSVGIGTTVPGQKLTVVGTANVTGLSYFGANVSMGGYQIRDLGTPKLSTDAATKAYVDSVTGGGSATWSTGSGIVYLNDTTDKVSIGGTTSGYKLDVVGNVSLNNSLFVTNAGKVGIGASSPKTLLNLYGAAPAFTIEDSTNAGPVVYLNASGADVAAIGYHRTVGGAIEFFTNLTALSTNSNNSRMIITKIGNVGIGTTSPTQKLDVRGNINVSGDIYVNNATSLATWAYNQTTGAITYVDIKILANNASWTSTYNSTYAGLSASSGTNTHLHNAANITAGTFGAGNFVFQNNLTVGGSTLFVNNGTGRVGIGTVTPNDALEVVGNARIEMTTNAGDLYFTDGTALGGNRTDFISTLAGLKGRLVNYNPDFSQGTNQYWRYNNAGGSNLVISILDATDSDALNRTPSSSGRVLNVSYNGAGTTSPGFGGFYIGVDDCSGSGYTDCYIKGNRYVYRIWAKIPSGRSITFASNSFGYGDSSYKWVTSQAGADDWRQYIMVQKIGTAGALGNYSSTGYWYIAGGADVAFEWYVASVEMIGVDEPATVDLTKSLNIGYKKDVSLDYGQLLTTRDAYLAVDSGNVGIGTTSPTQKLDVRGNINVSGDIYVNNATSLATWAYNQTTGAITYVDIKILANNASWTSTYNSTYAALSSTSGTNTHLHNAANITAGTFGAGNFVFQNNLTVGTNQLYVNKDLGRVGIGTASPAYRLDVSGDIRTSSYNRFITGSESGFIQSPVVGNTSWMRLHIGSLSYWDDANKNWTITQSGGGDFASVDFLNGGSISFISGRTGNTTSWKNITHSNYSSYEVMRIDSNGEVGIGTASPTHTLNVRGTFNTTGLSYFGSNISVGGFQINNLGTPKLSTDAATKAYVDSITGGGSATWSLTSGVVHLNDTTDKVSIGGTTSGYKLDVVGNVSLNNSLFVTSAGNVGIGTSSPGYALTVAGDVNLNNTFYVNESSGNVGIGTNGPTSKLHVVGSAFFSTNTGATPLIISRAPSGVRDVLNEEEVRFTIDDQSYIQEYLQDESAAAFYLKLNATASEAGTPSYSQLYLTSQGIFNWDDLLYVSSTDKVGIGTTNPTHTLNVAGTFNTTGLSYFGANVSMGGYQINNLGTPSLATDAATKAYVDSVTGGGSATWTHTGSYTILNNSGDYVGIGTATPGSKLEVLGQNITLFSGSTSQNVSFNIFDNSGSTAGFRIRYEDYTGATYLESLYDNAAGDIAIRTKVAGTPVSAIFIESAGNVGIGTSSPDAKLDIDGTLEVSGNNYGDTGATTKMRHYQDVAQYSSRTSSVVGTMQIALPKEWSNTMMQVKVSGYSYSNGGVWEAVIGGYNYGTSHSWVNYRGYITGKAPFSSVRLASNGTNNVILLGINSTTWSYPQIAVTDVITGFSSTNSWGTGWHITNITDESIMENVSSVTISQFMDTNGNMGLGTTTPASTLNVVGTFNTTGLSYFGSNISVGGFQINNLGTPKLSTDAATKAYVDSITGGGSATWSLTSGVVHLNDTTDKVSIGGTTSGYKLDVVGNVSLNNSLFVTNAGNVGIGTSSPGAKLDVRGSVNISGYYYGKIAVDDTRSIDSAPSAFDNEVSFDFKQRSAVGVPGSGTYSGMMTFAPWGDDSGDASHQLNFNEGGIYWRQGQPANTSSWESWYQLASNQMANNFSFMGNVGIGTSTPSQKLDVVGNVNVTQNLSVGGSTIYTQGGDMIFRV